MIGGQPVTRATGRVAVAGEQVAMHTDASQVATSWGYTGIVAAKLWHDEGMRRAYIETMMRQPTPGHVRVDDEHRVAASFGQLVHAPGCDPGDPSTMCLDDCTIVPCEEADATVVLIRVEVKVKAVHDAGE